jgi:carboxymethylenebutenolidase
MRMSDLAATFDAHVQAEFQDLDLDATMATMTADPYVHHVPTITGGNGTAGVRDLYQASVLVQAGLLDPRGLPIVGSEQAEALLDQTRPKNQLFSAAA